MPGFWIAFADTTGVRISGSEIELSPGPGEVEYPKEVAGTMLDTADGMVIQQQPPKDGRRRAWIWSGYPGWMVAYQDLYNRLEMLRSRYRLEAGAVTPYIWLKDEVTGELRKEVSIAGTGTAASTTLTDGTAPFPGSDGCKGYQVQLITGTGAGQLRTVSSNTTTVLTVPSWSGSGSVTYAVRGRVADWFRARVLGLTRTVPAGGIVKYEQTRLEFVIDDSAFNYLG